MPPLLPGKGITHINFENLVNAVENEISRREMRKSEVSKSNVSISKAKNAVNHGKKRTQGVRTRRIRIEIFGQKQ